MDPLTIAASIAAVKGAVKAAKNVQEIGHSLEELFHNQTEHKKKKKPTTRDEQVLQQRTGDDLSDDTSIGAVAADVIEEKRNETALLNLSREIDHKFGKGTWASIIKERERRIQNKKELDKRKKEKAVKDKIFWHKVLMESIKGFFIIVFVAGMIYLLIWAASAPKIR
jgi:hypothetical protein|tara:strand:+ start:995 stop:1498 length:504 start_codon:yes stop_codon:yes gene_type:complete